MAETRVNLRHLLEDIRDTYPFPIQEAIIAELVANSLDSGASEISFLTDPASRSVSVVDNGRGMTAKGLVRYHDIASTTKRRGKGIGFAGVGAKLSLLLAGKVLTETRREGFHRTTEWRLEGARRAPWKYVGDLGLLELKRGTAVRIVLRDEDSDLLKPGFIEKVIQSHFYPLLDEHIVERTLIDLYVARVRFLVDGRLVSAPEDEVILERRYFRAKLGKRTKLVCSGFIAKSRDDLPETQRGIAVSTLGKVIKRGWDWIGLNPMNPARLTGIVEIPAFAEILTTNKADFLTDARSLQKYYRYRKIVQKVIQPILSELGEMPTPREAPRKDVKPFEKELERILGDMINEFPELNPLMSRARTAGLASGILPDSEGDPIGRVAEGPDVIPGQPGGGGDGPGLEAEPGPLETERIEPDAQPVLPGIPKEARRRHPKLMLAFENEPDRPELAWLVENRVVVNEGHPAYIRAKAADAEAYHTMLSVAWMLSHYLEAEKSAQQFIGQFLQNWGRKPETHDPLRVMRGRPPKRK